MRILIIIAALFLLTPFISRPQGEKKLTSATLNIELPPGSSFETRPEEIKKYNDLLENLAAEKGYKTRKEDVEILHADHNAFKTILSEHKFKITQEGTDLYKITKGKNKWLLYMTDIPSAYLQLSNVQRSLQLSMLLSSLNSKTYWGMIILIKRLY